MARPSPKSLGDWLAAYGESHRHPLNERIHWICVPAIALSVVGLGWAASPWLAVAVCALAFGFYLRLSPSLALGMAALAAVSLWIASRLAHPLETSLVIFVVAWAAQFYGHRVEGRRPKFLQDVQFLLIGPIWLLSRLYQRLGLRV